MDSSEELIALFKHCIARVSIPGESGTGFFVAPGLLLTCAHVVGNVQSDGISVTVQWEGKTYTAKILHLLPYPYPDLALLKLEHAPLTHPCVFLHEAVRTDDNLYSYGYPKPRYNRDPSTFIFEGMEGDSPQFMKFKFGEARQGFSGAPLLNRRTGAVCGVMALTRGESTLMGGRGIPTGVVLKQFDELVTLQKEFHDKDRQWYDLLPESEVKQLSWQELHAICSKITDIRMSRARDKYSEELYLQRDHAHQVFMRFLEDPTKRGFVLVGGSGVGKSNFLFAAREELQSREDVCVLMYDAASLMEYPLMEAIDEDFREQVGWTTQHLWEKIKNIDRIDKRLVLFCMDALNEHEQPRELLKQLDKLIQKSWPWLKVVIVSRPEAWQSIKRGVKLAESLYYRGGATPGAISESFNYSERLDPFSRQELPPVYTRYQRVSQVQTPYEELSSRLRDIISDPFNLWLVTKTYKTIPEHLRTTTLIEDYVNALVEEGGRLRGGDPWWLENHLVPLMISQGHYDRVITSEEIAAADQALCKALLDREDSNGLPQLQSFRNLVDADILEREPHGLGFAIDFKYERFYDFFVGRRLFHMSEAQADRYGFFLSLIGEITQKPYLWGAVRNALVEEARKPGSETILKLCRIPEQRTKEMMVDVLTTFGWDAPEQVEEILKNLTPKEKKVTEWRKGQQLLGKATEDFDAAPRNAARIAIEVASNLHTPGVLENCALQTDSTIRTEAVRYAYMLWQHDQARGFEILEYLAQHAARGFLPNRAALESSIGLSILIFFEHYQDSSVLARLQHIWQGGIDKLLRIRRTREAREGVVRTLIRERIVSVVPDVAFWIFDHFPGYNIVTSAELEKFFKRKLTEKQLYRRLVQYINIDGSFRKDQMETDYFTVIKTNDLFLLLAFVLSMVPRACRDPQGLLPLLRRLFEAAKSDIDAYRYLSDITNVLENILNKSILDDSPILDEVFDFFVEAVETCQEYYARYPQYIRNRLSLAPQASFLGAYILHRYRKMGTVKTDPLLKRRIQDALLRNDVRFFDLLLTTELPFVAILWRSPQPALEALELFFSEVLKMLAKEDDKNDIPEFTLNFLARLRMHNPDKVEDFLEEQHAPDELRLRVRTRESTETIGELIGEGAWYFLRDEIILKSPQLRSQLIQIFDRAADCKNLHEWTDYFVRRIVNYIYGEEVLRQAE